MVEMSSYESCASRSRGAIYGLYTGDALAMPVHWYYDRAALRRDYGTVDRFKEPMNPHPDSILWRSMYCPPNERGDILREQAVYWGRPASTTTSFWRRARTRLTSNSARS